MARKLTSKQKVEAAKKRAAKEAEAEAEKAEVKPDEIRAGGADEGAAAGNGDGQADAGSAPEENQKPAAKPKATPKMVSVKTARGVKSRYRAGLVFGPEPVEIHLADLSEDQLEALDADPSLVVQLGE